MNNLSGELAQVMERIVAALLRLGPRIATALLLIAAGIVIAYILRFVVVRLISGLDRLIPSRRLQASLRKVAIGKPASEMLGTVVYWFVILLFTAAATETIGLPLVTTWLSGAARYLPSVLSSMLIGFAGLAAGVFVRDLVGSAAERTGMPNSAALARFLQIVVVVVSLLVAVDQLGVDTTLLTALIVTLMGMALLGGALAFGLGARTEVSNILASYYLQKTYRVGNQVSVGELSGEIVEISPTTVVLASQSGRITVPAKVFSETATLLLMDGTKT